MGISVNFSSDLFYKTFSFETSDSSTFSPRPRSLLSSSLLQSRSSFTPPSHILFGCPHVPGSPGSRDDSELLLLQNSCLWPAFHLPSLALSPSLSLLYQTIITQCHQFLPLHFYFPSSSPPQKRTHTERERERESICICVVESTKDLGSFQSRSTMTKYAISGILIPISLTTLTWVLPTSSSFFVLFQQTSIVPPFLLCREDEFWAFLCVSLAFFF